MQVLAQCLSLYPRRRDMCADTIDRKHQEGKKDAFPELGDIEYIL